MPGCAVTRAQFYAVRRLYRLAQNLSPMESEQAVRVMVESTHAMRAITGQWDVCDPARWPAGKLPGGAMVFVRSKPGTRSHWVWRAAATVTGRRFFRGQL